MMVYLYLAIINWNSKRDNERKSSIHVVCPAERTLAINDETSSLQGFINATLHALLFTSKDITGENRPIEYLATHYDEFTSVEGGFWAEFGVFNGATLEMAYNNLIKQSKFKGAIAGFDSFEGLPDTGADSIKEHLPHNMRKCVTSSQKQLSYIKVGSRTPLEASKSTIKCSCGSHPSRW